MNPNTVWKNEFGNNEFGFDACGRRIRKNAYGTKGIYGWEIDHIHPQSHNGSNSLANLQPLHWETNECKSDKTGYKRGECPIRCRA